MENRVVAVVVTYNRVELLKECIEALMLNKNLDILIVDNASTDGTKELVNNYLGESLKYVNTGSNLGGAGGFNYGIKEVLKNSNYRYVWLMDDDTIVNKDSLDKLLHKAELLKGEFSFLSSIVLWKDGNLCAMNVQRTSSNTVKNYEAIEKGIFYVESASFVSCLVNVESIRKVGLPIKEFFIYGDDLEYTIRLNTDKPGYVVSNSIVVHKMKENKGINIVDDDINRIDRYFYNYRNLLYIYKKYDRREYRIFKIKCYYLIIKIILKAHREKRKRIHAILKGIRKARKFSPKVEFAESELE